MLSSEEDLGDVVGLKGAKLLETENSCQAQWKLASLPYSM